MRNDTKNNENTKPIIEVRSIGKKYDIAHMRGGYVALRDVIANVLRSPFSFLKDKAEKAVGIKKKEEFWALRDVSFKVERGEVVGIIGSNGAGKSTLLKILSQITPPTEGEIVLRGRVGSLLEVGTGFHPELTGRENIFLNGAILGMKKKEIEKKFDEIVEFAGIGKFLDTPVKRYSSGMYVRLAFAVAAHMDPDILLVDEVLAVGDAEFQKKCLGKMDEITKKEGRTILFVSHNLSAIQQLCTKCILIENGKIAEIGSTEEVINVYVNRKTSTEIKPKHQTVTNEKEIDVLDSWVENKEGERVNAISAGETLRLAVKFRSNLATPKNVSFAFALNNMRSKEQISDLWDNNLPQPIFKEGVVVCEIPSLPLNTGLYSFNVCIRVNGFVSTLIKEVAVFEVVYGDFFGTGKLPEENQGSFLLKQRWEII